MKALSLGLLILGFVNFANATLVRSQGQVRQANLQSIELCQFLSENKFLEIGIVPGKWVGISKANGKCAVHTRLENGGYSGSITTNDYSDTFACVSIRIIKDGRGPDGVVCQDNSGEKFYFDANSNLLRGQ